jgi:hypothetical protein
VVTIAMAPLYWFHYYVLALIPSLWLLGGRPASRHPAALAVASLGMSSGILALGLWWLGWSEALPIIIALSWIPLWAALLLGVSSPGGGGPRAPASAREPEPAAGRSAGARRKR